MVENEAEVLQLVERQEALARPGSVAANPLARTSSVFEARSTAAAHQASSTMGRRGTHRLACPAQPRPDWKLHPWTIHFFIGQDAFETGCTTVTEAAKVLTPLLSQPIHRANMGSAALAGKTERFG